MRLILLDEIASAVDAILPASFTDAMRKSVQDAVLSTIRKMNLVSRDKVEELEKTLLQLHEKNQPKNLNNLNLLPKAAPGLDLLKLSKMKAGLSHQIQKPTTNTSAR